MMHETRGEDPITEGHRLTTRGPGFFFSFLDSAFDKLFSRMPLMLHVARCFWLGAEFHSASHSVALLA